MGSHETGRPSVYIVDDHPVLAHGLAVLLEDAGFAVTGIASGSAAALAALAERPTDLAVVDLSLEEGHGQELVRALVEGAPGLGVVVYSVNEDPGPVRGALEAGARGYVTKREHPDVLIACLGAVLAGGVFLSPLASRVHAGPRGGGADLPQGAGKALSAAELRVYRLVGQGWSSPEIGEQLGIAPGTVETYYDRILDKIGLATRRELRRHAIAAATRSD